MNSLAFSAEEHVMRQILMKHFHLQDRHLACSLLERETTNGFGRMRRSSQFC